VELGQLVLGSGDTDGLTEQRFGLLKGAELHRTFCGTAQGDSRLGGERIGFVSGLGILVRCEVLAGERSASSSVGSDSK
jgi:hypothetical protein